MSATEVTPKWPVPIGRAAYHGITGEIVDAIEPQTEADPAALIVQLLVLIGNMIGRGPHFRAEADAHYTNLSVVLVGETAKGRKGSSFNRIKLPLESVDDGWAASRITSGLSSGEGLIHAVRDPIHQQRPVRQKGRIVGYEDEIIDAGVDDKRLLVVESEFASTLRVMERDGNTLSAVMRQAWDGANLRIMTKNSAETAAAPHISVVAHVTRDEVRRYLGRTELGNGFANRFLWVCVRRSKLLPEGGGTIATDEGVMAALRGAVEFARTLGEVRRDDEAAVVWREAYPDLSHGHPGLLGAVTSRAEAQVMRIAMIYALLDASEAIQRVHLGAALEVWRYCFESAAYVFGTAMGDPVADDLLAALRRAGANGMTRTEINTNVFARNRSALEIGRAVAVLEGQGLARCVMAPTGGRPSERWIAA